MYLVIIDLHYNNLDDDNFDEDNPETIVLVRIIAWCNKYKHLKKDKQTIIAYSMASNETAGLENDKR